MEYFLIIDAGTSSIKIFAYDDMGNIIKKVVKEISPVFPRPGWVEQDPIKYWENILDGIDEILNDFGRPLAVGITNQRATTVIWDKDSGEPLYNMITWQDTRALNVAEELSNKSIIRLGRLIGKTAYFFTRILKSLGGSRKIKYLITLAYFKFGCNQPAIHLRWLMDNVNEVSRGIRSGNALFGTLDSWIIWKFLKIHVTDYTNASATGLFDPFSVKWSETIVKILDIPRKILPKIVDSMKFLGRSKHILNSPVTAVIADQQSSLYSAGGVKRGSAKITNGTGTFIDINVGNKPAPALKGTYPMIAIKSGRYTGYLIEGIVQSTGSAVDWLVNIGLLSHPSEASRVSEMIKDSFGITFIPTLAGIGTPYWINSLRGSIFGLSLGARREHLVRALLEGIGYRITSVIKIIEEITNISVNDIIADGNASRHDFLLKIIASLSGKNIYRVKNLDGTSRGAFLLARGVIRKLNVKDAWIPPKIEKKFTPDRKIKFNADLWRKMLNTILSIEV